MIAPLLQWLAVPLVRWAVTGLGLAAIFGLWLWRHDAKITQRAEAVVIERAAEAGKAAEARSDRAHQAATKPGAAERVMKLYCRDCKP